MRRDDRHEDDRHDESHSPTILVVEDEADEAAVLATALGDAGFAVVTAGSGREALSLLEAPPPDLVLLDLRLPDVSGFRLLRVLKHDPATAAVPVLVLTALRFAEAAKVGRYGAEAFLTKPYRLEDLITRVHELLARAGTTRRTPAP